MPALSWNEIRQRAIKFSRDWSEEVREQAESQTFWNELFNVFGMQRRQVATFEEKVKSIKGNHRIDLFWKGKFLAEHKSRGEDMGKATSQAFNYIHELINEGRGDECPRYVAISDFKSILFYDLEPDDQLELLKGNANAAEVVEIPVADFHKHVKHFAFIAGLKTQKLREQDTANMRAAEIMARLHDTLAVGGYAQPDLERLLVRLLFCLFADDTSIFTPDTFDLYIENRTRADGSDLGLHLEKLFRILDTPEDKRAKTLDEELAAFPYVNGELFTEHLEFADFNADMRNALLAACRFDWSRISPAIFGSLFQGVMDAKERRQLGAHYTSERDILKLICPLFLDDLHAEFEHIRADRSSRRKPRLTEFQNKLASLNFLDPACGCGNFLVIAYRELRTLELEVLQELYKGKSSVQQFTATDIQLLSKVDVDQFYGIEIDVWASRIAETALWLTDHQANMRLSEAFGQIFLRIPLKKSPHILCANALRTDWNDLLPAKNCSYVLGNPPFVGKQFQTEEQKVDFEMLLPNLKGSGVLDYVTLWYFKTMDYIAQTGIRCAFVSTNSISQGEQVAVLWKELFRKGAKIHFAYRTFSWQSEAKGKAHVHVVIIGFGKQDKDEKIIFESPDETGALLSETVSNINPYLISGSDIVIDARSKPICSVPEIVFGSMPNDGGHLILSSTEKDELLKIEPNARPYLRRFIGSEEFINGIERWCLWLEGIAPSELAHLPEVLKRVQAVKKHRLASKRKTTQELAAVPTLFGEIRQPKSRYLLVPGVSSETRTYIPIGFIPASVVASNATLVIPNASLYHFGVLTSKMHMIWVKQVAGRLKSDFRYSAKLVYNNFPWALDVSPEKREQIEALASKILEIRVAYGDGRVGFLPSPKWKTGVRPCSLADLYNPLTMPPDLLKAHHALDKTVDQCYRKAPFTSERERIEYLFAEYERLTCPLALTEKKPTRKRKNATTGFAKAHHSSEGLAVEFSEVSEGLLLKPTKPHG